MTRRTRLAAAVVVLMAGCGHPPQHGPEASGRATPSSHINPANIGRVRGAMPPDYEVGGLTGVSSPAALWGLHGAWTADPPPCAVLADPLGERAGTARGVSGSGPGGLSYAVVAASTTGPVTLDRGRLGECPHWTITQGRTTARVQVIDPPRIDGADTVGLASAISTFVEGGTQITSRADTFTAYLGDYYAFTAVVADPGAPHPALGAGFAADLLKKTVSALRS
ncbi:DUF5642 family protein [Mycobacterium sp. pUA109]|uniref:DUF5642 family protein n=1 Tax=Mycobacterium sp. pUA109 TaxID=3238982 RepID=UPI00351AB1D7